MSYDVVAIAVDLEKVKAAIGSKNKKLLAELKTEFVAEMEQIDELQEDLLDEDEGPYSAADALKCLIDGGPYREDAALAYYFCFEILCYHFGDSMDNDAWTGLKSKWFEAVFAGLKQAGLALKPAQSLAYLPFSGPPVQAIPDTEEYPNLGYMTKDEVATARAALAKADLAKVKDEEVRAAIEQLLSWLDECAKLDRDLVCTYA